MSLLSQFRQVIEVMASVRGEDVEELANVMYLNTNKLFFNNPNIFVAT